MRRTDSSIVLLMGYIRLAFRFFEKFLRIAVGLDEYEFQLILKQFFFQILPLLNYPTVFAQFRIIQRLFRPRLIMKGPQKLIMMI